MPFKSTKAQLDLNAEELNALQVISRSRTEASSRVERARILLAYYEGLTVSEIARKHNTNRPRIELQINKALQMGALNSLDDLHRSGRTSVITDEAKAWLISIACTKPLEHGYENEMWTTALLADYVRDHCEQAGHPCMKKLARGTVSKILSSHELQPHRITYYLERRDPDFESKMSQVLLIYREVMTALDAGTEEYFAYISYDEKPGIQALESTAPDLMPVSGKHKNIARDYEYIRHGTLSLLAGIDLITGKITAMVQERHRSAEFIEFLKKLDEEYSAEYRIKIILDNHSSHTSKETRAYLSTVPNRFEFVFTPKHASWLNLIEALFSKLTRTLLRGIRVKSKEELALRIVRHICHLNESPVVFRWKYKMDEANSEY